jgi:sugar O-acyltransferase (sialic acid O-acetyltransferase NeuD family)
LRAMDKGIMIIGTGAQAKYALETFHLRKTPVCGIVALPGETGVTWKDGAEVIGVLDTHFEDIYHDHGGPPLMLASSSPRRKEEIRERIRHLNPAYVNALHPNAVIARTAVLGHGVIVNANAVVQPFARIGNHVMIHAGAVVEHDCIVEDFVNLAPRVTLAGYVKVGRCSVVYTGAVVVPGIKIGEFATIGAGAVVLEDVVEHGTAVGVPARVIKARGL